MSIQPVQSNVFQLTVTGDGIDSPDGSAPPAGLTPEALLTYCSTRLNSIDGQINTMMAQQQAAGNEQTQLQTIMEQFNADASTIDSSSSGSGSMDNQTKCEQLEENLEGLISYMQVNDPGNSELGALEQLHDSVMATGSGPFTDPTTGAFHGYYATDTSNSGPGATPIGKTLPPGEAQTPDNTIDATEFQSFSSTLTQISGNLNSNAQIQMIQIQSLMSDRTTAIQLTTNIMQAYDDSTSKVVANIGQ
jgi:hypothetical protein